MSFLEMRTQEEAHAWWKGAELLKLKCPWAPLGRGPLARDSRAVECEGSLTSGRRAQAVAAVSQGECLEGEEVRTWDG